MKDDYSYLHHNFKVRRNRWRHNNYLISFFDAGFGGRAFSGAKYERSKWERGRQEWQDNFYEVHHPISIAGRKGYHIFWEDGLAVLYNDEDGGEQLEVVRDY